MELTLGNKNERISALTTVAVHVLVLLIAIFFKTCYTAPDPAVDPEQGVQISFGPVSADEGETEETFDAPEEVTEPEKQTEPETEPVVEPETVPSEEPTVEPETDPLSSEDYVEPKKETKEEPKKTPEKEPIKEPTKEPKKPVETKPKLPGLGGVADYKGGSGDKAGEAGDPNATEKKLLSGGLGTAEIPKGWGIAKEPKPSVKADGVITISVEFNRSGEVIPGSIKRVRGDLNFFNTHLKEITRSLEKDMKITQTDGSFAPKSRNKATFRFEFKGH